MQSRDEPSEVSKHACTRFLQEAVPRCLQELLVLCCRAACRHDAMQVLGGVHMLGRHGAVAKLMADLRRPAAADAGRKCCHAHTVPPGRAWRYDNWCLDGGVTKLQLGRWRAWEHGMNALALVLLSLLF